ncbi:MAG TPA: hypothetical protein VII00_01335 [bacterium]
MSAQNQYIPGVCNIGPEEIQKRKLVGWVGLIATFGLWTFFIWNNTPAPWRLTLFFPGIISAVGFLQAYRHFCAYFGFAALFNFGKAGETGNVDSEEFRIRDRREAWKILIYSTIIGLAVAFLGFAL